MFSAKDDIVEWSLGVPPCKPTRGFAVRWARISERTINGWNKIIIVRTVKNKQSSLATELTRRVTSLEPHNSTCQYTKAEPLPVFLLLADTTFCSTVNAPSLLLEVFRVEMNLSLIHNGLHLACFGSR